MTKPNKDMCFTDALILWGTLNCDNNPPIKEKIDFIIDHIDEYEINYKTWEVSVKFTQPIERVSMTVTL